MRIDRYHQSLIPMSSGRKPGPVTAVEPVATGFPNQGRPAAPLFGLKVTLEEGPIDRRVRQALEAYLNHRESSDESVTLLYGVDVYV